MGQATYTLGDAPVIAIRHCDGDLEIKGHDEATVVMTSDALPDGMQGAEGLVIDNCADDVHLRVPYHATVTVDGAGGDVRVERLATLTVGRVDGDITVMAITHSCAIRAVDGDVRASEVSNLSLGTVNGDADLDGMTGRFDLSHVEGDVMLRGAFEGVGHAHIDGDLVLDTLFIPGHTYEATVGGDAMVRLRDDANLTLEATVEGDVHGLDYHDAHGTIKKAVWGEGHARLALHVGGDLRVKGSGAHARQRVTMRADSSAGAAGVAAGASDLSVTTTRRVEPHGPEESQPPQPDSALSVLESLARGEISPAEADDLLSRRSYTARDTSGAAPFP